MSQSAVVDHTDEMCNRKKLIIQAVLSFLVAFYPKTFAKRIIVAVLIAVDTPVKSIVSLLGMGKSTVYNLRKSLFSASSEEEITALFSMKAGC